ncbi:MAG: SUMF1/EgtB/PvdO family nonheme iron enzyme [Saprospirales bacterium]|nr:SUMF1/EgtB/PvdO family nonheme iron enzyme [Saprospirales bacterium]
MLWTRQLLWSISPTILQPFRESIKAIDPDEYKKLMERYYPVMVEVQGGVFDMGCGNSLDPVREGDETLHKQEVSSFQMAKYETTWWQFAFSVTLLARILKRAPGSPGRTGG